MDWKQLLASITRSVDQEPQLRSPNLNEYAQRWVQSVNEGALSQLILCGRRSLQRALKEYVAQDHQERNHQGKGNVLFMPATDRTPRRDGPIRSRERLGGLLKYDERQAA